ncbi:MAG TPA: aminotransferase class III-fold pyridoxal phosphate-dependent enzyme, partial [Phycisphaerae bacterium]
LQQNVESVELSRKLLELATEGGSGGSGAKLAHCFLTTSGAMANENGLKLAFHKKPGATRILAFEHAFAGRTMALSQITDKAAYRVGLPAVLAVDYVPFFDGERPAESIAKAVEVLRRHMARFPGAHAALWCEFVQGEGGFYAGSREFFEAIFKAAREKQVAVVADEIQTFGRTSKLFAFQHFGVEEWVDIVTVGKMLQVCATLFTDALKPGPGLLSQTFTAATSALFGAKAMLSALESAGAFGREGRNMQVNARFATRLAEIEGRHAGWIRGPFGLGGMIAFTPFDGADEKVKKLLAALFENGVVAFLNGSNPARVRFLPPVPVLTDEHIDEVCAILEQTMAQIAGGG